MVWSWALVIRWERAMARHTATFWPRPPHWQELFEPSAFSCLFWFRYAYWLNLFANNICVLSMVYLTIYCWSDGYYIAERECVTREYSSWAWTSIIASSTGCVLAVTFLNASMCRALLSFSVNWRQGYGRCMVISTCVLVSLVGLGSWTISRCDFTASNHSVWVYSVNGTDALLDNFGSQKQ